MRSLFRILSLMLVLATGAAFLECAVTAIGDAGELEDNCDRDDFSDDDDEWSYDSTSGGGALLTWARFGWEDLGRELEQHRPPPVGPPRA